MSLPMLPLLLFASQVLQAAKSGPTATGCTLNVLANNNVTPLLLNSSRLFPNPDYYGVTNVSFDEGEILYVACPEADTTISNYPLVPDGEAVQCVGNTTIRALTSNKTLDFNSLTCYQKFRPFYYEQLVNETCELGFTVRYVGQVFGSQFVPVLKLCFDTKKIVPLYSKYTTNQWSTLFKYYNPNVKFNSVSNSLFDNLVPSEVYAQIKQTIENLGVFNHITDYAYLLPGQLAPYDDFLSLYQRDLTFDYSNTAFQWNPVNMGNWKSIVWSIQWLITHGASLGEVTMLTGTLRIASLPNKAGNPVELFLSGDGRMPVPAWFWKLMISPSTQSAVLFFVYNNPYIVKSLVDEEFKTICKEDILGNLTWVAYNINNVNGDNGYAYACAVGRDYMVDETIKEIVNNALEESNSPSGLLLNLPLLGDSKTDKMPQNTN